MVTSPYIYIHTLYLYLWTSQHITNVAGAFVSINFVAYVRHVAMLAKMLLSASCLPSSSNLSLDLRNLVDALLPSSLVFAQSSVNAPFNTPDAVCGTQFQLMYIRVATSLHCFKQLLKNYLLRSFFSAV